MPEALEICSLHLKVLFFLTKFGVGFLSVTSDCNQNRGKFVALLKETYPPRVLSNFAGGPASLVTEQGMRRGDVSQRGAGAEVLVRQLWGGRRGGGGQRQCPEGEDGHCLACCLQQGHSRGSPGMRKAPKGAFWSTAGQQWPWAASSVATGCWMSRLTVSKSIRVMRKTVSKTQHW